MKNAVRLLAVACSILIGLNAPPAAARRVALVIGNAAYKVGPLANPLNDAAAVAEAFEKQLKFDKVILRTNLGFIDFHAALAELARETSGADIGVVYFAGHGTEVGGRNFLIPVDATLGRARALDLEAIPLDTVLGQLDGVRRLRLVILDACRNNLFALPGAKRSVSRGLARIEPEDSTLVVYAAKDGTTADDGIGGRHSPFTAALLKHIAAPSLEVRFLFGQVADEVAAATNRAQQPYLYGNLGGKQFFLQPQSAVPPVSGAAVTPPAVVATEAAEAWAAVKDSTSIAQLEVIATRFKGTVYADLARARIGELKKQEESKKVALAAPTSAMAPEADGLRFISFNATLNGQSDTTLGNGKKEHEAHDIVIDDKAWIIRFEGNRIFLVMSSDTDYKSYTVACGRGAASWTQGYKPLNDHQVKLKCAYSLSDNRYTINASSILAMDMGGIRSSIEDRHRIVFRLSEGKCGLIGYEAEKRLSYGGASKFMRDVGFSSKTRGTLRAGSCAISQ